jgi:hypothetical protein
MRKLVLTAALLTLAGCVSVPFPNPFAHAGVKAAEDAPEPLRQVAMDIETTVQAGERDPKLQDRDGVIVNTDLIKQLVKTRAARSEMVNQFLDTGFGREDKNGMIMVLHSKDYKKATSARQRDRDALLVLNENNDRWSLFEGIVKAGKDAHISTPVVQAAFHDARIKNMKKGQKYQEVVVEEKPARGK